MKFGDIIRMLLEENEMTQKDLAFNMNMATSTVFTLTQSVKWTRKPLIR